MFRDTRDTTLRHSVSVPHSTPRIHTIHARRVCSITAHSNISCPHEGPPRREAPPLCVSRKQERGSMLYWPRPAAQPLSCIHLYSLLASLASASVIHSLERSSAMASSAGDSPSL